MPLNLDNKSSATITVKLVHHGNGNWQSQYQLEGDSQWHTDPIEWKPKADNPTLQLTFNLGQNVKKLLDATGFTLNPKAKGATQQTATVNRPSQQTNDSFKVKGTDGHVHDPQIVITPQ